MIRDRGGLSRAGRRGDVICFPAITVKSPLQVWASNDRTGRAFDAGASPTERVTIVVAALTICATRDWQSGAIACPEDIPGDNANRDHHSALRT